VHGATSRMGLLLISPKHAIFSLALSATGCIRAIAALTDLVGKHSERRHKPHDNRFLA